MPAARTAEEVRARRHVGCQPGRSLGLGFKVERHSDGNLKEVSAVLDVLSDAAWDAGVRTGAWRETFSRWMPLALDAAHIRKALPLAEQALAGIAKKQQQTHTL